MKKKNKKQQKNILSNLLPGVIAIITIIATNYVIINPYNDKIESLLEKIYKLENNIELLNFKINTIYSVNNKRAEINRLKDTIKKRKDKKNKEEIPKIQVFDIIRKEEDDDMNTIFYAE